MIYKGNWIYYHTAEKKRPDSLYGNPSPYFRKCFNVNEEIESVYLYVSAVGCFKAYINGEPVSDDCLSPGRCDCSKRLPIVKYDITDKIKTENAVGIVCGDGWAVGAVPFGNSFRRNCYSDEIYLYAVIEIRNVSGNVSYIYSDKSWKAYSGSIRYSGIYTGECVDNRECRSGFSEFGFDDSSWKSVSEDSFPKCYLLCDDEIPLIKRTGFVKPVKTAVKEAYVLYDFGKLFVAV